MRKLVKICILVLFVWICLVSTVAAQGPVVRAMLFYSPSCPYCHTVITEVLPPLFQMYGGQTEVLYIPPTSEEEAVGPSLVAIFGESLEILYVNTYTQLGYELFQGVIDLLSIPPEMHVVPMLIVDDQILLGGNQIPTQFPSIIQEGLESGGIDWVELAALPGALEKLIPVPTEPSPTEGATQRPSESAAPTADVTESVPNETASSADPTETSNPLPTMNNPTDALLVTELSVLERIKLDLTGNVLSIIVLIGMVLSLAMVTSRLIYPDEIEREQEVSYLIPILCAVGMGVAAYLTYVEASGTVAVCGPVGDCNAVQQSDYAFLFGIIPVGALGMVGYIAIVLAWLIARFGHEPWIYWAKFCLLGMSVFGTIFSIYLTFLEPFVIGATCAWCVTSSVIMTALMWLTLAPGAEAIARLRGLKRVGHRKR